MELTLTGVGQEVSLENMERPLNFLLFKRMDGTPLRIHVPEETVKELLTALRSDTAPPQREGLPSDPVEEGATEFGGDDYEQPPEPTEEQMEQLNSEDDVPSL